MPENGPQQKKTVTKKVMVTEKINGAKNHPLLIQSFSMVFQ